MTTKFTIKSINPLNDNVYQILLQPAESVQFEAGHYLRIHVPDAGKISYSIASGPSESIIELHIQENAGNDISTKVLDLLRSNDSVEADIPCGKCVLTEPLSSESPIILIAAGTGFTQMKCILNTLSERGISNPIHLYWGNRKASGYYGSELLDRWKEQKNFTFHPVVSHAEEDCNWNGRHGMLHESVCEDFADLSDAQVYISGSPVMVYATLDHLIENGLKEENAFSDVFEYAPRK